MKSIVFVSTSPYGDYNHSLKDALRPFETHYNTSGKEYPKISLIEKVKRINPEYIIAGVEKYDKEVLDLCPNLKLIARVGIGLNSVDIEECKRRGIAVTYTPDAPSNAVAELTIGQILLGIRFVPTADKIIRKGGWERYIGKELSNVKVGLIGFGRIGKLVYDKIKRLGAKEIMVNDIDKNQFRNNSELMIASKEEILKNCDVISLHIPLEDETIDFIKKDDFQKMKPDAILINNSRGKIVNEQDLYAWLHTNERAFAALDTFKTEPYVGPLSNLNNIFLTAHMGSCSMKSRNDMESGALAEVLNAINGKEFNNQVV
ncbi:hypothetical protein HOA55_00380 [archaeon]|jgi:D-3-phosphoglycerate dehydrogenase / 2-oxoglutarate reductase|nr:hypothetical protein [archaeon]MBT3578287.1 hypothetical protein [archaeon]MBT6819792.1 hypothetical protein [archaeon]MBT6955817.1 hypothetical protein [archaeon]MBT7025574.1 hypothetical protein [archaeon]